jgi:hypothetical protein
MGEELQGPGSWTCHRMFSVVLHLTGRFFSEDTPFPSGPRQPGQFPVGAENAVAATSNTAKQHTIDSFFPIMVSPEVAAEAAELRDLGIIAFLFFSDKHKYSLFCRWREPSVVPTCCDFSGLIRQINRFLTRKLTK